MIGKDQECNLYANQCNLLNSDDACTHGTLYTKVANTVGECVSWKTFDTIQEQNWDRAVWHYDTDGAKMTVSRYYEPTFGKVSGRLNVRHDNTFTSKIAWYPCDDADRISNNLTQVEVMKINTGCAATWFDYKARDPIPENAVIAGTKINGNHVYLAKFRHNDDGATVYQLYGNWPNRFQNGFYAKEVQCHKKKNMKLLILL